MVRFPTSDVVEGTLQTLRSAHDWSVETVSTARGVDAGGGGGGDLIKKQTNANQR